MWLINSAFELLQKRWPIIPDFDVESSVFLLAVAPIMKHSFLRALNLPLHHVLVSLIALD
jgi:hypothetical protein